MKQLTGVMITLCLPPPFEKNQNNAIGVRVAQAKTGGLLYFYCENRLLRYVHIYIPGYAFFRNNVIGATDIIILIFKRKYSKVF